MLRTPTIVTLLALTLNVCGQELSGPARVIDGDTLAFGNIRVRIAGIDAPEFDQWCWNSSGFPYACGKVSTLHLENILRGKTVTCFRLEIDSFGRYLAHCKANNLNLGSHMVEAGLAVATSSTYLNQEAKARIAARGIWQGRFTQPSEWRKQRK